MYTEMFTHYISITIIDPIVHASRVDAIMYTFKFQGA